MYMSKKKRKSDGIWVSDERRITDECRQIYPTLYQLQRAVFIVTAIVWIITLLGPTVLNRVVSGYAAWGDTFEIVTLVLAFVMLVAYIIANYFWQQKMKKFREKYEIQKYKKQQEAAKRKRTQKK